jgi:hypothetical protein
MVFRLSSPMASLTICRCPLINSIGMAIRAFDSSVLAQERIEGMLTCSASRRERYGNWINGGREIVNGFGKRSRRKERNFTHDAGQCSRV